MKNTSLNNIELHEKVSVSNFFELNFSENEM